MRALLSILALLLNACNDGGGGSATREAACQTVGAAQCLKTLECNLGFTDAELCTQLIVDRCCGEAGTCDDGLSADQRVAFQQCEADLEAQPCAQAAQPPASCVALSLQ